VIPSSVVLGADSFSWCRPLESVRFESGCRLERIGESAFSGNGLKSILIPSSVVVLGEGSFSGCKSLESVTFENGSRLERIEGSAFRESALELILVPGSVTFIDGSAFVATPVELAREFDDLFGEDEEEEEEGEDTSQR
jgi:hypothetical protein